jgi:O-antigen/teichoic acid export membrane protein
VPAASHPLPALHPVKIDTDGSSYPLSAQTTEPRPERRIAINSGLLLLAYGFQALVSLVIVGIVARYLSQAGLGRYALIISFIELFTAFVDMGMNRILVREIAKNKYDATRLTSAIWTMRMMLALVVFVVVALLAAGNGDSYLWLATMAFFIAQVIYLMGDVFAAMFQGYQRMEYSFWSILIAQVVLLTTTLSVVWLDLGLLALFLVRIMANGARLIYLWWTSARKGYATAHFMPPVVAGAVVAVRSLPAAARAWRGSGRQAARALVAAQGERLVKHWNDAALAWHLFVESLPVGISLLLHGYIWRAGVVLTVLWLGQEQGDLVNGVLYGPLRAVQQMHIMPAAFAAALLPALSNRAAHRIDEFDSAFAKSIKLFTALSLLIALAFTFLADPMVELLLGQNIDLSTAAQVLAWLGWVIVFYFPNWLYSVTLVALGRQKIETLGLVLGLVAGIAVAWWAIPRYLAMGVVYGILTAESVLFVVGTAAMWKHFRWRTLLPSLAKLVVACGLTGLIFMTGDRLWTALTEAGRIPQGTLSVLLEIIVVGSVGLAGFVGAVLLLRTFDANERDGIRLMLGIKRDQR